MYSSLSDFMSYAATTRIIARIIGIILALYLITNKPIKVQNTSISNSAIGSIILGLIFAFRLGSQPIGWGTGGDRENYAFKLLYSSDNISKQTDPLFSYISDFIYSLVSSLEAYFYIIAAIYIILYLWACRRLVDKRQMWLFIVVILSFGFISYGYNTLRAGVAYSLLLLGISFKPRSWAQLICLALSAGFHFSMIIPIVMFIISMVYPKTKVFFCLWLLSIPLSFVAGNYFNTIFSGLSADTRTSYLTTANDNYNIGFRFNFIIYSLMPIIVGYYFIFKRSFKSKLYISIFNTYILTNIFWILVIRSNFSDRFAYLSWFLIPIILAYPLLNQPSIVDKPNTWLATIIAGEVLFSLFV